MGGPGNRPRFPPATLHLVPPPAPVRRWPEAQCGSCEPQAACSVACVFILKADGEADCHEAAQLASFFLSFLFLALQVKSYV